MRRQAADNIRLPLDTAPLTAALAELVASIRPAHGLISFQHEAVLCLAVFGPQGEGVAPPPLWMLERLERQWRAGDVPLWQLVVLAGLPVNAPRGARGWDGRWGGALVQVEFFIRCAVRTYVPRAPAPVVLTPDDVDSLSSSILDHLLSGTCTCGKGWCARDHRINGWVLTGPVTLATSAVQAVFGSADGFKPKFFERSLLFFLLHEEPHHLKIGTVVVWRCQRCARRADGTGERNLVPQRCATCGDDFDRTGSRCDVIVDQVPTAYYKEEYWLKCRGKIGEKNCGNRYEETRAGCPICRQPRPTPRRGRKRKRKKAWTPILSDPRAHPDVVWRLLRGDMPPRHNGVWRERFDDPTADDEADPSEADDEEDR